MSPKVTAPAEVTTEDFPEEPLTTDFQEEPDTSDDFPKEPVTTDFQEEPDTSEFEDLGETYTTRKMDSADELAVENVLDGAERARGLLATGEGAGPESLSTTAAPERGLASKAFDVATDVVADVAGGIVETPRQVVGGVVDFTVQTVELVDDMDRFFAENVVDFDPLKIERRALIQTLRNLSPSDARTTTGRLVRDTAAFLTGFTPLAGQVNKARQALNLTGAVSKSIASGAAAGVALGISVDPAEESLDEFVQKHPELEEPINAYLDGQDTEERLKERLKNTAFGVVVGPLLDGTVAGLRVLRQLRAAQKIKKGGKQPPAAAASRPRVPREDVSIGEVNGPRFRTQEANQDLVARRLKAAERKVAEKFPNLSRDEIRAKAAESEQKRQLISGGKRIEVNLERIESVDDVKALFQEFADVFRKDIDKARRGIRSNEATKEAAELLGIDGHELLARRHGSAPTPEEVVAFRTIWANAAEQVQVFAERAGSPNSGELDQFAFNRSVIAFQAITEQVLGARAETGRALQAWAIKVGGDSERARLISELLDGAGGEKVTRAMARRIADLGTLGVEPGGVAAAIRHGPLWKRRAVAGMAAVRESFVLGLLWSPKTHVVNTASGVIVAIQQIAERAVAARFSLLRGARNEGVEIGEAMAMANALKGGIWDAFKMSAASLRDPTVLSRRLDIPTINMKRAISAEAFEVSSQTGMGRFLDYAGKVTSVSGKMLGAEDGFFKSIGYRMQVYALAHREAVRRGGTREEIATIYTSIINNPPESIRMEAVDAALYNTFTQEAGNAAKLIMKLRDSGNFAPWFLFLPFVRTPSNILGYTFERTPIAPLMSRFRDNVAAGGARRDLALARWATGSAVAALAMDLAWEGRITGSGPVDRGEREALLRQGWQPFSFETGGVWHRYDRTDPLGLMFSTAAEASIMLKETNAGPDNMPEINELLIAMTAAVSESVTEKTYFQGFANLIAAMDDPKRHLDRVLNRTVSAAVPFSTGLRTVAQAIDPDQPKVTGPWEAVQSMIPVLRGKLPKNRDLWGEIITTGEVYGKAWDVFSPVRATEEVPTPIDAEMVRNRVNYGRISRKTDFGTPPVAVDFHQYPNVYEEYTRLAGNALINPATGLGAKDFLNAVVTGNHDMSDDYLTRTDGSEGTKGDFIRTWMGRYRKLAQRELELDGSPFVNVTQENAAEFFNFRKEIADKQADRPGFRIQ